MTKEFFLLCETETQKPIDICFLLNDSIFPIKYLLDHGDKEELIQYIKALNNYKKLLEFVKELSDHQNDVGYDSIIPEKAFDLLQEIGEI